MSNIDRDVKGAIANVLQTDSVLLAMLPENVNWYDQDDYDKQKKWSVVPLEKFEASNPLPQITIQLGGDTRLGTHLNETLIYIRCYNSSNKTFVEITNILGRVKDLLDGTFINLAGSTSIELVLETTQAELIDQAYDLPFREQRYHWQRV